MRPSYPTSASGRTIAKPSSIISIRYRNHSRTSTVREYPKTNHSTEFQWKISNNTVTKCKETIFSCLQRKVWFWFSHNIFERTESAYSRVGHVNYGQLGNRVANLWIHGPLGLGYRAGARLTYHARHTPLSPKYKTKHKITKFCNLKIKWPKSVWSVENGVGWSIPPNRLPPKMVRWICQIGTDARDYVYPRFLQF